MHIHNLNQWKHSHHFHIVDEQGERNTRRVIILTVVMMVIEIAAGFLFGSMALLADGWHMGTHAAALGITAFAYMYARRHADDPRYSFGTGKVGVLGGFASAVVLAMVALLMSVESTERLLFPETIKYNEAIAVAVVGLIVNLVSAFLLQGSHHNHFHENDHEGEHEDENKNESGHHHHDHNLRAAYLHVLADALTSLLAIFALLTGKVLGWGWMDPAIGIVGSIVIARWSYGLLKDTSKILLDRDVDQETISAIYSAIESDSDNRISDLHIWRLSSDKLATIISVVTHYPRQPEHYKGLVGEIKDLAHISVEVNVCELEPCLPYEKK